MFDDARESAKKLDRDQMSHILRRHKEAEDAAGRELTIEEAAEVVADAIREFWAQRGVKATANFEIIEPTEDE